MPPSVSRHLTSSSRTKELTLEHVSMRPTMSVVLTPSVRFTCQKMVKHEGTLELPLYGSRACICIEHLLSHTFRYASPCSSMFARFACMDAFVRLQFP